MLTVNVVILAGTVAADPVTRRMPSGDEVTELRISVAETGRRLLPLPVAAWHATVRRATVDARRIFPSAFGLRAFRGGSRTDEHVNRKSGSHGLFLSCSSPTLPQRSLVHKARPRTKREAAVGVRGPLQRPPRPTVRRWFLVGLRADEEPEPSHAGYCASDQRLADRRVLDAEGVLRGAA